MANEGCKCSTKVNHHHYNEKPTTAQILGAYAKELQAEGASDDTIKTLIIEAARHLLRDGGELTVRRPDAGPFGGLVAG